MFSASFAFYDPSGQLCTLLEVHVDDGVMTGTGRFYDQICKPLRENLHIGSEEEGELKLHGRTVIQTKDLIDVHQDEYIAEVKKIYILAARRRAPASPLAKKRAHTIQIGSTTACMGDTIGYADRILRCLGAAAA